MQYEATLGETIFDIALKLDESTANINDKNLNFEIVEHEDSQILFRVGSKLHKIRNITMDGGVIECTVDGKWVTADLKDEQQLLLERLGFKTASEKSVGLLQAPMPGKILDLLSAEGDEVELGDPVAILEAMKMQNHIKSTREGTVHKIHINKGDRITKDTCLIEFLPE